MLITPEIASKRSSSRDLAGRLLHHEHLDKHGSAHECWHECKSEMKHPAFWVLNILLTFLLFPFEHALYTHVVPFTWVSNLLGLG